MGKLGKDKKHKHKNEQFPSKSVATVLIPVDLVDQFVVDVAELIGHA
jgi:hypothetical protein